MTQVPKALSSCAFAGRIGVARRDITPPVGIFARNWGAAKHDAATGVHRPLTLTALTIRPGDGGPPLVIIDTDLGWWRSLATERAFRGRVLAALELDEARLIFGLSHTHAAPPLSEPDPTWGGGHLLPAYLQKVERATIDAAREALANAGPATLEWNTGRCNLAANRDLQDPAPTPGRDRLVCGYNPAEPADDTLIVGRVSDALGNVVATIVNYACHPTTLAWDNTLISPDFVGAMRETIESHTGGAPALFLQGASGELAPKFQYVGDPAVADANGRHLAFAALATLADMQPAGTKLAYDRVVESGAPLAVWKRVPNDASTTLTAKTRHVSLTIRHLPTAEEYERQRQGNADRVIEERLRRQRDVRKQLGDGPEFALPFWVWRVGDAVLVGSMIEAYSWLAVELRRRFAGRAVIVVGLVNGTLGYLPRAAMYDRDVYQVWQTPFERGCLEALTEAMAGEIDKVLEEQHG